LEQQFNLITDLVDDYFKIIDEIVPKELSAKEKTAFIN
jgi:hypothetical protein